MRSGFLHRLARRGSASSRRGQGSVLARGVLRDRQLPRCGRRSPENGEPCAHAGSRQGDAEVAARRRGRPCPESAARPAVGRCRRRRARQLDVSRGASARRTGGRLLSRHLGEVADHAVATDWYDRHRAVLRDDERGVDKVVRALSAARQPALKILDRELAFFRKNRGALREPQGQGLPGRVGRRRSRQQGAGQPAHETGGPALERAVRTSLPSGRRRVASTRLAMTGTHAANENRAAVAA